MLNNYDSAYYEVEEVPQKRPRMEEQKIEKKFFRLEHKRDDEKGVMTLQLPEPITIDANTYFAGMAMENITYLNKWQEEFTFKLEVFIYDGRSRTPSDSKLFTIQFEVSNNILDDMMNFVIMRMKRLVIPPSDTSSYVDDRDSGLDIAQCLKLNYTNKKLTVINNHGRIGFLLVFNDETKNQLKLARNRYRIGPFTPEVVQIEQCPALQEEMISLQSPVISRTVTMDGGKRELYSFLSAPANNGFNTINPMPDLQYKEIEVPCVIREITVYVTDVEGNAVDFSRQLRSFSGTAARFQGNNIDCILNIIILIKKSQ